MSTLYKSPTIGTIITDLSAASTAEINYLDSFLTILNSSKPTTYSCYDPTGNYATRLPATITPKLAYAVMYFNTVMPVDGVLFNKSSGTYWFIGLDSPNNRCNIYKIVNEAVELIPDKLSILELREELREVGESGYEAWVARVKPHLDYTAPTGTETTGSINISNADLNAENLFVGDEFEFADWDGSFGEKARDKIKRAALPDESGNVGKFLQHNVTGNSWETVKEVPSSTSSQSGQVLTVGEDGTPGWAAGGGGGSQLYVHDLRLALNDTYYQGEMHILATCTDSATWTYANILSKWEQYVGAVGALPYTSWCFRPSSGFLSNKSNAKKFVIPLSSAIANTGSQIKVHCFVTIVTFDLSTGAFSATNGRDSFNIISVEDNVSSIL